MELRSVSGIYTDNLGVISRRYRVRNFRGRVSHFNQSEARKHPFSLLIGWNMRSFPENLVLYQLLIIIGLETQVLLNCNDTCEALI